MKHNITYILGTQFCLTLTKNRVEYYFIIYLFIHSFMFDLVIFIKTSLIISWFSSSSFLAYFPSKRKYFWVCVKYHITAFLFLGTFRIVQDVPKVNTYFKWLQTFHSWNDFNESNWKWLIIQEGFMHNTLHFHLCSSTVSTFP